MYNQTISISTEINTDSIKPNYFYEEESFIFPLFNEEEEISNICDGFLQSKRAREKEDEKDDIIINEDTKRKFVPKYDKIISKNNREEKENPLYNKENDLLKKNNSTKLGTNEIEKTNISDRKKQKDNFSIELFGELTDWIFKKIKKSGIEGIKKPNYNIFTHDTNLIDIYIFLGINFKNIICMTPKIKEKMNRFFIDLKAKKNYKKKAVFITEQSKEKKDALKLLKLFGYLKENENPDINKLNELIIKLLKEEGYKDPYEDILYKKDKDNISEILIEKGEKKFRGYQIKNYNILKNKDIYEFNKNLKKIIKEFYKSPEFQSFSKKISICKINENFKKQKKNAYSLLDNDNDNGFIRMIEEDCNLTENQKNIIEDFTNYFENKDLIEKELNKYIENYIPKE